MINLIEVQFVSINDQLLLNRYQSESIFDEMILECFE